MVLPVPCESKTLEHRIRQIEKVVSHSIAVMPLYCDSWREVWTRMYSFRTSINNKWNQCDCFGQGPLCYRLRLSRWRWASSSSSDLYCPRMHLGRGKSDSQTLEFLQRGTKTILAPNWLVHQVSRILENIACLHQQILLSSH